MRRLRKRLNARGFTMLEVMVGLIIFSLGLLTLLSMVVISIQGNVWSSKTTLSVQLVRQTIEQLKNTRADELETSSSDEVNGVQRYWYIQPVTGYPELRRATIYLSWYDNFNNPRYSTTVTYFEPKQ